MLSPANGWLGVDGDNFVSDPDTLQIRSGITRTDDEQMAIYQPSAEWQTAELTLNQFG
jgi:hypothetical protein